ncbi:MAG: helix-turn-helix domain-containing protein [Ruminococcaceae bacterium]|nr:helix-turn-helix domain-containing protein [Oscillospiraceae bacterium]
MTEGQLPKAWHDLVEKLAFMPAVVKAIEKIHDISWSMTPNKHEHYEMVYVKKGTATFVIDGVDVQMVPNSVIIIKPQKSHKFTVRSENCELIVLYFQLKGKKDSGNSHASLTDFVDYIEDESTGAYIYLKLSKKNDVVYVLNRILRERMKFQIWGDFLSCLLIMELFVLLSRTLKQEWEQSAKNRNLKLHELLNIAKEYIDNNYAKELTLSQVAKYIYLSDSYFAHSFKDKFGISPKSYILKIRIEEAKELLENTDLRIADVALSVGFSSQQRFNDIFRKYTDMTPLRYRQTKKRERLNRG